MTQREITNEVLYDEILKINHILVGNGDPKKGLVFKVEQNATAIQNLRDNCSIIQEKKERDKQKLSELDLLKTIKELNSDKDKSKKELDIESRKLKIQEIKDKTILWLIRLGIFYLVGEQAYKNLM